VTLWKSAPLSKPICRNRELCQSQCRLLSKGSGWIFCLMMPPAPMVSSGVGSVVIEMVMKGFDLCRRRFSMSKMVCSREVATLARKFRG
jgi:hypothetical protein